MLSELSEEKKKDISFQIVVALRDTFSVALKNEQPPTYENAIRMLHDISPALYEDVVGILDSKNPTDTAKRYQELAKINSLNGEEVSALDLVSEEIQKYQKLLDSPAATDLSPEEKRFTQNFIFQLIAARTSLTPERK